MLYPMTSARLRREAAAPGAPLDAGMPSDEASSVPFWSGSTDNANAAESSLDELTPLQRAALVSRASAPGTLTEEFDFSRKSK